MITLRTGLLAAAAFAVPHAAQAADVITGTATLATHVRAFDTPGFAVERDFVAYGGFQGGVRVAAGDVDGDSFIDIITAPGPGAGPHVKAFNGVTGAEIRSFFAYDTSFTGGVFVGAGDVDNDGFADIVTGAGAGAPGGHVKVFSGANGAELSSFFAYGVGFLGGVRVATGDVNGDGFADIVTGAGAGAPGGHVKVFDGQTGAELRSFLAFQTSFNGGVSVAAGMWGGVDALIVGAGAGGGPHVKVFRLSDLSELASFFAFGPDFFGGVNVATGMFDGRDALYVSMASLGGDVRVFDAGSESGNFLGGFVPYGGFTGGIEIASAAVQAPIPEPATWATLILGFAVVGSAVRRRQGSAFA